jgi:hypothetical protein
MKAKGANVQHRGGAKKRPDGTGVRKWVKRTVRLPPDVDAPVGAAAGALGVGFSEAVERSLRVVGVPYLTDLAARGGAGAPAAAPGGAETASGRG